MHQSKGQQPPNYETQRMKKQSHYDDNLYPEQQVLSRRNPTVYWRSLLWNPIFVCLLVWNVLLSSSHTGVVAADATFGGAIQMGIQSAVRHHSFSSLVEQQQPSRRRGYPSESSSLASTITPSRKDNDSLSAIQQVLTTKTSRTSSSSSNLSSKKKNLKQQQQQQQQQKILEDKKKQLQIQSRSLTFYESLIAGALSRSIAQTIMHPANTMKTILQTPQGLQQYGNVVELMKPKYLKLCTRGAGANLLLSIPHGAINFATLEFVRNEVLDKFLLTRCITDEDLRTNIKKNFAPGLDFLSSAISTFCCSIISTPQMMIVDNIMAGNYPNLPKAITGLASSRGIVNGFYSGWWPGIAGKIPSYGMTWAFFQQLKVIRLRLTDNRPATNLENSIMGCIASGTTVSIMIPLDTIKTRLVTQGSVSAAGAIPYKGIIDCYLRVAKEEGMGAFYKGLPPRLVSVVPMIGIQFGVYEFMKTMLLRRQLDRSNAALPISSTTTTATTKISNAKAERKKKNQANKIEEPSYESSFEHVLEEAAMEVAADPESPYPAPHFKDQAPTKKIRNR